MAVTIRVVDFETTGTAPPTEVVEVGTCDLSGPPWEVAAPVSRLCRSSLITAETRAIHHISPAEVAACEPFAGVALDGVIAVAAHRAAFEAQWLGHLPEGVHLICTYKCALRVWELVAWTREPAALPRITIGKDRGKKWSEVDGGFLSWMLRQQDMDPDLAWNARRELQRRAAP